MPLILLAFGLAFAEEIVLHAGPPEDAVVRASADAGVPFWDLRPVQLGDLRTGAVPQVVGAGQPEPCAGDPTTNSAIREIVTRADKAIVYKHDGTRASADLDSAAAALACLGEQAEASLAAQLFFLRGLAAQQAGDEVATRAAWARAFSFQPGLGWDDRFAPDGQGAFEAVRAQRQKAPTGRVHLGPGTEGALVSVDGRLPSAAAGHLELTEGVHLVQILQPALSTHEVAVDSNRPVALLVPSALGDKVLGLVDAPRWQAIMGAVLDETIGPEATAYVWTGSRTWRVSDTWTLLPSRPEPIEARRDRLGTALLGGGVAGLVVGSTGAALGWTARERDRQAPGVETATEEAARMERAYAHEAWAIGATGVAVLGAASTATGLLLRAGGPTVAAVPLDGGAAVAITFSR